MGRRKLTPIHPGEILLEEFLNEIVHGKRCTTGDTALRLVTRGVPK